MIPFGTAPIIPSILLLSIALFQKEAVLFQKEAAIRPVLWKEVDGFYFFRQLSRQTRLTGQTILTGGWVSP